MGSALDSHSTAPKELDPSWSEPIELQFWIFEEDGHWVSLIEDYDVVGQGPTFEGAFNNAKELLEDYFGMIIGEGGSLADARRPTPLLERARLHALRIERSLRRRIDHHVTGVVRRTHRERFC